MYISRITKQINLKKMPILSQKGPNHVRKNSHPANNLKIGHLQKFILAKCKNFHFTVIYLFIYYVFIYYVIMLFIYLFIYLSIFCVVKQYKVKNN